MKKRVPVFIAVVVTEVVAARIKNSYGWDDKFFKSGRTEGGWEAFIGANKPALIKRASTLATVWENGSGTKYVVLAGQIGGEIKVVRTFKAY